MTEDRFPAALRKTLEHEGVYGNDRKDPGGQTFRGISRVYWSDWDGWPLVDDWLANQTQGRATEPPTTLQEKVEEFYRRFFWNRIAGDELAVISQDIASEVFDTAVNLGVHDSVRILQIALNMQQQAMPTHPPLVVDGRMGPKTLGFLRLYLSMQPGIRWKNEQILLNCLNGEQYLIYKANPRHTYFRGWFLRV